ncbi:Holliday junction branch migration protein RuvA [Candidatus Saccharibacteria bacterium]|nr:Holliday junction branch migration protein RuvA [Candidatus Saccharibacteria bacterium]
MIAHIFGKLAEKFENTVIVDVHGVGYEITIPATDTDGLTLGDEVKFYTYHAVRENSEELFGFSSLAAKKLFELLISVQGVGPKAGIAILSLGSTEQVRNAIANSDSAFVSKAAGVGKKTAERIIVDLGDKVGTPSKFGKTAIEDAKPTEPDEALDALIALGFQLKEATLALENIDKKLPTAERVRLALKSR